ncbi:MAG: conjugal transfer protein TraC [Firmicutes bacterium]|nr:conjugal transfer protein TraC [Bacillota bacterium]
MKLFNRIEINFIKKENEYEEPLEETAQDFLGVDDIKNGVIRHSNRHYSLVVEVNPINYNLLSDNEQNQVEDSFMEFLNSLNYPIQLYVQTRYLDVSGHLNFLKSKSQSAKGELQNYIANLHEFMRLKLAQKPVLIKRYFVVISCKAEKPRQSMQELERRVNHIIEGLYGCGIVARPLNTEEVTDLIYAAQNKKRAYVTNIKDSVSYGHKSLYTTKGG